MRAVINTGPALQGGSKGFPFATSQVVQSHRGLTKATLGGGGGGGGGGLIPWAISGRLSLCQLLRGRHHQLAH